MILKAPISEMYLESSLEDSPSSSFSHQGPPSFGFHGSPLGVLKEIFCHNLSHFFSSITYQFVFSFNVSNNDNGCNSGSKSKEDNNEVHHIMPGFLAEEHFWCQGNHAHKHLTKQKNTHIDGTQKLPQQENKQKGRLQGS